MSEQICATCVFFMQEGSTGVCRRYPEWVSTMTDGWCGEYKQPHAFRSARLPMTKELEGDNVPVIAEPTKRL